MKSTEDSTQALLATLALELGPGHPQGLRPGAFTPACLSLMAPLCLSSPLSFSSCFSSLVSLQEHHRNYTLLPSGRRDRHFFWTMGPLSPCSLSLSSLLPPDANQGIFPKDHYLPDRGKDAESANQGFSLLLPYCVAFSSPIVSSPT